MIDSVIMDQRGEMHHLDDGCDDDCIACRRAGGVTGEQHERGAKHLPFHRKEMPRGDRKHGNVARDGLLHLFANLLQVVTHWRLHLVQRHDAQSVTRLWRVDGARRHAICSARFSRSPISRK